MPVLLHSAALPCIHIGGVELIACQQASRTALRCWQAIIFLAFRAGVSPVDEHCSSQILDLSYRPLPTIRRLADTAKENRGDVTKSKLIVGRCCLGTVPSRSSATIPLAGVVDTAAFDLATLAESVREFEAFCP